MKCVVIHSKASLERKLKALRSKIAKAAQKVYDKWEQDDSGYSEHFMHDGGICQDIAEAICDVFAQPVAYLKSF